MAAVGPDVPPIKACGLLTDADVEEALGLLDIPWEERELIEFGAGEECTWTHARDGEDVEGLAVSIGPGSPDDFAPGATLLDTTGTPVEGVGAAAVWFGGSDRGILSVVQPTSLGYAFARLELQRVDLDDEGRLETARVIGARAVSRLPGAAPAARDLDTTTLEHPPPDQAAAGFVENLLAREAAGEWTRGEGLVATLEMFLGEREADDVLVHPELASYEGTGIIRMAQDYLALEPDEPQHEAVRALLDRLVFSEERLEAMAGIGPVSAGLGAPARRSGRLPIVPLQDAVTDCAAFFMPHVPPPGISTCLEWRPTNVPPGGEPGKYRVFVPAPGLPQAGWTEDDYDNGLTALEHAASVLERLRPLPPVNMIFSVFVGETPLASAATPGFGLPCTVTLFPKMQDEEQGAFQQTIAHELGHCLTGENFPAQQAVGYTLTKWWEEGVAEYLSNVVYSMVDDEWRRWLPELVDTEQAAGLLARAYDNFAWFQEVATTRGTDGVLDLLSVLAHCSVSGPEERGDCDGQTIRDQAIGLGQWPGVEELYHRFVQHTTDEAVRDDGGRNMAHWMGELNLDVEADAIIETGRFVTLLEPWEMARHHLVVPGDDFACVEYEVSDGVLASARRGAPGNDIIQGPWSDALQDVFTGEMVLVASAGVDGGELSVTVRDIVETPADCDPTHRASGGGCAIRICGRSSFYRSRGQLPSWLEQMLPPL
ncbi:MAG TPA: hypothetical protein VFH63_01950 [candidate division Zixibacteria bacterium]|nr:hypothetical protein [candidate division Zixibacteria bacterium]